MKKLLSLLMCFVFLQAETFALRGGPSNSAGEVVFGTYSGVLTENDGLGNDIGLFLLIALSAGASSGQVVIFSESGTDAGTYSGFLTGLSDTSRGGTGNFYGIFSANAVSQSSAATRSAAGALNVRAVKGIGNSATQRLTGTATSRTTTITNHSFNIIAVGLPLSDVSTGPLKTFIVDGFQTPGTSTLNGFSLGAGG